MKKLIKSLLTSLLLAVCMTTLLLFGKLLEKISELSMFTGMRLLEIGTNIGVKLEDEVDNLKKSKVGP